MMNQLGRVKLPPLRVLLKRILLNSASREYVTGGTGVAVGGRGARVGTMLGVKVGSGVAVGLGVNVGVGEGGNGSGVPPMMTVTAGVTPKIVRTCRVGSSCATMTMPCALIVAGGKAVSCGTGEFVAVAGGGGMLVAAASVVGVGAAEQAATRIVEPKTSAKKRKSSERFMWNLRTCATMHVQLR